MKEIKEIKQIKQKQRTSGRDRPYIRPSPPLRQVVTASMSGHNRPYIRP